MRLETLRRRIDALLSDQDERDAPPAAIVLLPAKTGHGPEDEDSLPLPRAQRISPRAVVITYDIDAGQPSAAEIKRLVAEARS